MTNRPETGTEILLGIFCSACKKDCRMIVDRHPLVFWCETDGCARQGVRYEMTGICQREVA